MLARWIQSNDIISIYTSLFVINENASHCRMCLFAPIQDSESELREQPDDKHCDEISYV